MTPIQTEMGSETDKAVNFIEDWMKEYEDENPLVEQVSEHARQ